MFKYDAFISYRHAELDKFVAETLHKELESFKAPKSVIKQLGNSLKRTRIKRVFRDRDELPITSDLADPITSALKDSEYLIVICSPRIHASEWCRQEMSQFIHYRNRDNIFAVLIEGEPSDSFPKELLFDGDRPVEPLAAEVRGKNRKEIRKKIKDEVIRLAAPMIGCDYDDLKQRHKEQRQKKIITRISIALIISLLFAVVSTTMALYISRQSKQIAAQSQEIEGLYQDTLKTNASLTTDQALMELKSGNRLGALAIVRGILPDSMQDTTKPYVAKAQEALTRITQVYANGTSIVPAYSIDTTSPITYTLLSPDQKKLLIYEQNNTITLWDIADNSCITRIEPDSMFGTGGKDTLRFLDDDTFAYEADGESRIYSISKQKVIKTADGQIDQFFEPDEEDLHSSQASYHISYSEEEIEGQLFSKISSVVTASNAAGTVIFQYPFDGERVQALALVSSNSREYLACICYDSVTVLDTVTGKNIGNANLGGKILDYRVVDPSLPYLQLITSNNDLIVMNCESSLCVMGTGGYTGTGNAILGANIGKGFLVTYEGSSNRAVLFSYAAGNTVEDLFAGIGYLDFIRVSKDQRYLAFADDENLSVFDLEKDSLLCQLPRMDAMIDLGFNSETPNELIVISYDRTVLVSLEKGTILSEYENTDTPISLIQDTTYMSSYDYEQYFITDVENNTTLSKTAYPEYSSFHNFFTIGKNLTQFAYLDMEEKQLCTGSLEQSAAVKTLPLNVSLVNNVILNDTCDLLYVSYKNGSCEIYRAADLSLQNTLTDLATPVNAVHSIPEQNSTILVTLGMGYVYNAENACIAEIPDYVGACTQKNRYLTASGKHLFAVSIFDYEALLKEADRQLSNS